MQDLGLPSPRILGLPVLMVSLADDPLESVERSLAFASLIFLPYSNRAATAVALSWESSLDSPCALGLLPINIGSSINMS